jgi:hypothetical protein
MALAEDLPDARDLHRVVDQEIHRVARALATLSELRSGGQISQECFSGRNGLLLERQQQLAKELVRLAGEIAILEEHPSASAQAMDSRLAVQRRWTDLSREEKKCLVETSVERIVVGKADVQIHLT